MFNFGMIPTLKKAKDTFMSNHPKTKTFMNQVNGKGFCKGQEIAVAVRYPDGTEYKTGIRVTDKDLDLLNAITELLK